MATMPFEKTAHGGLTQFPDWHSLAELIAAVGPGRESAQRYDARGAWSGTEGWHDAVALVKQPKRDPLFERMSAEVERLVTDLVEVPVYYHTDEPGAGSLDVGAWCSNEPDHWIVRDTVYTDGTGGIVHVDINIAASWSIDADVLRMRGAAVGALVTALELSGRRTRVTVRMAAAGMKGGEKWEGVIVLKEPEHELDRARLAFALGNPAMFRRVGFRLLEMHPRARSMGAYDGGGYGIPVRKAIHPNGADVTLEAAHGHDAQWKDEQAAVAWVLANLKAQGVTLRESAG